MENAVTQNKQRTRNKVASDRVKKISVRSWVELHFTTISYILSFNYSYRYEINLIQMMYTAILRDPGAVSRVRRKGSTKVFKYRRNSPWVPTLTKLFPKIQADAGSWLGTKKCFVLLCPICEQVLVSSLRECIHDGYCLATLAQFVHQTCVSKGNFCFLLS